MNKKAVEMTKRELLVSYENDERVYCSSIIIIPRRSKKHKTYTKMIIIMVDKDDIPFKKLIDFNAIHFEGINGLGLNWGNYSYMPKFMPQDKLVKKQYVINFLQRSGCIRIYNPLHKIICKKNNEDLEIFAERI